MSKNSSVNCVRRGKTNTCSVHKIVDEILLQASYGTMILTSFEPNFKVTPIHIKTDSYAIRSHITDGYYSYREPDKIKHAYSYYHQQNGHIRSPSLTFSRQIRHQTGNMLLQSTFAQHNNWQVPCIYFRSSICYTYLGNCDEKERDSIQLQHQWNV